MRDVDAFSYEPYLNTGLRAVIFSVLAIIVGAKYASVDISSVGSSDTATEPKSSQPRVVTDIPVSTSPYQGEGEDYRKGDDDAKVTIVKFSDFQCPACASAAPVLDRLYKKYFGAVRVVYRNYPLSNICNESVSRVMHGFACEIAVLARCAGAKGKFWEYHDLAFANYGKLPHSKKESPLPTEWAKRLGLSDAEVSSCKASKNILAKLKSDVAIGNKAGVRGTPSIFINGKLYKGQTTVSALDREVQKVLNQ
jgi:protein-disulfide isomerase